MNPTTSDVRGELVIKTDDEEGVGYELCTAAARIQLSDTNEVVIEVEERVPDDEIGRSFSFYVDCIGATELAKALLEHAQNGVPQ